MTADEFFASSKNNNPIGSGPYKVDSIKRNKDGIATSYTFDSFNKFTLGKIRQRSPRLKSGETKEIENR
jgi:hypothetical protein